MILVEISFSKNDDNVTNAWTIDIYGMLAFPLKQSGKYNDEIDFLYWKGGDGVDSSFFW